PNPPARPTRLVLAAARLSGAVVALMVMLAFGVPLRALGEDITPSDSVFQLFTYSRDGKGIARGTAFFIDSSGLALTNSNVVYRAQPGPEDYVLLAVIGSEFYGVDIICASALEVDPFAVPKGPVARDIAEIR